MKRLAYSGILCALAVLCAMAIPAAVGQAPTLKGGAQSAAPPARPRQPGGLLSDELGTYHTIEGVKAEGPKLDTLAVDTVDGKKLAKPILLRVEGAYIADYNLRPVRLDLPAKQRCVFKGFETGGMGGAPPAVYEAAKEQGWKDLPMNQTGWGWTPYFVVLVVVEPRELELPQPPRPDVPMRGAR